MALAPTCPRCGAAARPGAHFCGQCGAGLEATGATAEPSRAASAAKPLGDTVLAARSAIEGERRQVTVLSSELVSLNGASERWDPEDVRHVMNHCFGLITDVVHGLAGTINQYTGHGVMALFGAPRPLEDGPQRAVQAALQIQRVLREDSRGLEAERGLSATMRIGLHTSVVVVGRIGDDLRMDYTAMGDATALAAGLQQAAGPGHVLISEATHGLVAADFDAIDRGAFQVPGQRAPIHGYEVTGARVRRAVPEVAAVRGVTPYVGRERELAALRELIARARGGQGQVAFVAGEPGIGKSRLIDELRRQLARDGEDVNWLVGHCVSFGQAMPLRPVIDQLRAHFGIADADDSSAVIAKIETDLDRVDALSGYAPSLRYLLGVDPGDVDTPLLEPSVRRARVFHAVRSWMLHLAAQRPTVLLFEDLQWADRSTERYLASLIDAIASAPLVVIATYRSGYAPTLDRRSECAILTLPRLSDSESRAVATGVLGSALGPTALPPGALEKARGVPLFIEELTKTVLALKARERTAPLDVPSTVEDAIAARIDCLDESGKHALQAAGVIGPYFRKPLLARLVDPPTQLDASIAELERLEFIEVRNGVGEPWCAFKHAVIQEVVDRGLTPHRRQELHRRAGLAIEDAYGGRLSEHYAELAYHFACAEDWEKTWTHAQRAGAQAADVDATREASAHFARALEAAERMTPWPGRAAVADLHARQAAALGALRDYQGGADHYAQALALAREVDDRRAMLRMLLGLADLYYDWHRPAEAQAQRDEALNVAEALHDAEAQAVGLAGRAVCIAAWQGPIAEARRTARAAVDLAERATSPNVRARTFVCLGSILQWRGDLEGCLPYLSEGAGLAQEAHAGAILGRALAELGHAHRAQGRYEHALRWYGELRLYAAQTDDRFWAVRIPAAIGEVHLELYDSQRCIELCRAGHDLAERLEAWPAPRGHSLVAIAMAHLQQGELGAAETVLQRAEELLDGDAWTRWCWHVPLLRARGELALASGELENAWGYASQSLELAMQADARRDVAHAKLVLGEVAAAQDRLPEAEKLLRAAVTLAEHMSTARELWLAASALGRILERLGRDHEAETPLTLSAQTIEAIIVELTDPHLRAGFVAAPPVADVYRRLRRPAPSPRLSV